VTTILFEHHHLYYLPQFIPVIEEMKSRDSFQIAVSLSHDASPKERTIFRNAIGLLDIELIESHSETERRSILLSRGFDVIVVGNRGHIETIADNNSLVVMAYHGIGLKRSYYRDTSPRVGLRAVESEERFQELQAQGQRNLVLCGFPKLDPLSGLNGFDHDRWLEDRDLDPGREVILYAPTFYPSSLGQMLPILPELSKWANVIIKLHHFSWFMPKYRAHHVKYEGIASRTEHIHLAPPDEYDILPYYRVSDLLVSDISSTLFEFLALNRPIIQADFADLRPKHRLLPWLIGRRLDSRRFHEMEFTYRCDSPDRIRILVDHAFKHLDEMSSQRSKAADRFLYRLDGKASARLVDAIEDRLSRTSHRLSKRNSRDGTAC